MIPWISMLPSVLGTVGEAIKKAIPDKDLAKRLETDIQHQLLTQDNSEFQGQVDIVLAEANGESWIQRTWRPLLMLWFAGLVGAHWMGFTPENLSQATIDHLLTIVQVGLAGYVVGRSGEKIMKEYKK